MLGVADYISEGETIKRVLTAKIGRLCPTGHATGSQDPQNWESRDKMCSLGLFSFLNRLGLPTLVTVEVLFHVVFNTGAKSTLWLWSWASGLESQLLYLLSCVTLRLLLSTL